MRFNYFISETVSNLKRNVLMTVAAISTVAISLLLLGGVRILDMTVQNVTQSWEAKVEVSAFLRDDIAPGELEELRADLSQMDEVQSFTYVAKEQAFEDFKELYEDQPALWQTIPEDSLPASLRIKLTDADYTELVAARISGAAGVDDVDFGGDFIRRLIQVNSLLRTITLSMSVILLIAAAALIANTIRLAIYARREEIGIMKLVGATNWFIRIPFMLEGVFAAMVGAVISGLIVVLANELLFSRVGNFLTFLGPVFDFHAGQILWVLALLVLVGAGVGIVGSTMALRRFLEV